MTIRVQRTIIHEYPDLDAMHEDMNRWFLLGDSDSPPSVAPRGSIKRWRTRVLTPDDRSNDLVATGSLFGCLSRIAGPDILLVETMYKNGIAQNTLRVEFPGLLKSPYILTVEREPTEERP